MPCDPVLPLQPARNPKIGVGGGNLKEGKTSRQAGVLQPVTRDVKRAREVGQG